MTSSACNARAEFLVQLILMLKFWFVQIKNSNLMDGIVCILVAFCRELKLSTRVSSLSLSSRLARKSSEDLSDLRRSSLSPLVLSLLSFGVDVAPPGGLTLLLSGVRGSETGVSTAGFLLTTLSLLLSSSTSVSSSRVSLGAGSLRERRGEGWGRGEVGAGTSVGTGSWDSPKSLANQECSTHCFTVSLSLSTKNHF